MDKMTEERFLNDLLNKRIVYLEGEICYEEAKRIGAVIIWLNAQNDSNEITLYVRSYGGSVSAGLDIHDIVRHSKAPITGIVYSSANSMATVVLQACKRRKALRHSEITIHNIKINYYKEWHVFEDNLEEALRDTKRMQQRIYEILAERTGRTIEDIKKVCRESKTMSAEEAKEFGLIDEVI